MPNSFINAFKILNPMKTRINTNGLSRSEIIIVASEEDANEIEAMKAKFNNEKEQEDE